MSVNKNGNRPGRYRTGAYPGRVRIVGGRWRGWRLEVLPAAPLRPTPDRVRETLFNWLQNRIEGAVCLDLCAGTGALGIEAVSRGAARAVLVERDGELCRGLRRQAADLQAGAYLHVRHADALAWLRACTERFDLVFLDPPYGMAELREACCRFLTDSPVLRPGGLLYLEAAGGEAAPSGFEPFRQARAGRIRFELLVRSAASGAMIDTLPLSGSR